MNLDPVPPIPTVPNNYRAGDLLIDAGVRQVTREGLQLNITGLSFDLLLTLVRAAPNLVSTRELMDRVWPGVIVSPETLIQRIMLLRQGLGDSAESPRYVAAVRGHGYRMAAQVTTLAALPTQPPEAETSASTLAIAPHAGVSATAQAPGAASADTLEFSPAEPAVRAAPATRRGIALGLAGALALVIGAAGLWWVQEHRGGLPVAAAVAPPEAPHLASSPIPRSSVAVMPFANLTGDPTRDYLGDGMAEELIDSLAQVPGLKVPARTSTFAYKGHNADIRQIARDLGVATVLEGSVRSAGERLRVGVRLVDAASGFQIWSQDYDRQSPDLFKLQDDLAAQTLQALRGYLNVSLPAPVTHAPKTRDVQAYDLYLQARAVPLFGVPSWRRAVALLDQALTRDPNFADALGYRANLLTLSATRDAAPAALLKDAEHSAKRALELNPNSAAALAAGEMLQAIHWRWLDVEQSYRATMITSANDPLFRSLHGELLLLPAGRLRQAESELMASYHLAPAYGFTLHELMVVESLLGRDAQAIRFVELNYGLYANGAPMGGEDALPYLRRALRTGRYTEAAKLGAQALTSPFRAAGGEAVMQIFCSALADPSRRPAARRALRGFVPQVLASSDGDRVRMFFVEALTMVDDRDAAYDLIEHLLDRRLKATGAGDFDWGEIWTAEMRPFRQDPRFQALVTRLKLPEYWAQYGPPDECDFNYGKLSCH